MDFVHLNTASDQYARLNYHGQVSHRINYKHGRNGNYQSSKNEIR